MLFMTNGLDDQEDLLSFILRELMILKRQWSMQTEWSWMAGGFGWITPSPRERIHPPQASTWAGQRTVEVVVVVEQVGAATLTMIGGMTEDMTDTKNTTTDIGDDPHRLTIAGTGHDQDPVPTVQGATEDQKNEQLRT